MSDTRGTGCGVWPILLKHTKFYDACAWHDQAYTEGSFAEDHFDRRFVDDWFLSQMLGMSKGFVDKLQARVMYGVARLLGHFWWEGK